MVGTDITPLVLALLAAFYLFGGVVKGAASFGLPLMAIPLSAFLLPVPSAIAVSLLPVFVSNLVQITQNWSARHRLAGYWPFFLALVTAIPIGLQVLARADQQVLSLLVGLAVLAFVASRLTGWQPKLAPRPTARVLAGAGFASGLSAGATSFVGFPSLLVFTAYRLERREMAFVSAVMFILSGLLLGSGLTAFGLLGGPEVVASLLCVPAAALGQSLGQRIRNRLDEDRLRTFVFALLALSGTSLALRGVL